MRKSAPRSTIASIETLKIARYCSSPSGSCRPARWCVLLAGKNEVDILGFTKEQHADNESQGSNHNRIPQAKVDVARGLHHREGRRRHQAADPAIADVVRKADGRVADAGGEQLYQHGGDRT